MGLSDNRDTPITAHSCVGGELVGAGDGLRTRYLDLGKVALYQVSYSRSGRGRIITRHAWAPTRPLPRPSLTGT